MLPRISQAVTLLVVAAALIAAAPAGAQETPTTADTVTDTTAPPEIAPGETVTVESTVTETATPDDTTTVELPTWGWALVAAGATAVLIATFALGRASKRNRQRTGERLPAERSQTLLAALSGWLAEGWVIESQSSTEAVVRKGTERRLLSVDAGGAFGRSELPPAEPDPRWTAPGPEPPGGD